MLQYNNKTPKRAIARNLNIPISTVHTVIKRVIKGRLK